ncbi:S1 family peptidase [Streptomyces oceani]|uniref:Streptogrisin n=1 Tax=Streptomyces oceani TaxID=1075402 RepID=A0A1E7KGY9_9ACTN|nr:S1 family peptidase [Streptomyces oceani]OEV03136.1 streptogrisin [Streptomyces oceani]
MRHNRRISKRRVAVAGTSVAALVAGALTFSSANASEPASADTLSSSAATTLAQEITSEIKGDAGAYYDAEAKKLVVNVVDAAAKDKVQETGAEAKVVDHTMKQLTSVKKSMTENDMVGTSRAIDPKTNKVVITADKTVKGEKLAKLKKQVAAQDGKAVLKHTDGKFTTRIAGGDAIYGGGSRCSLGFNVTVNGQPGFLTAGHCTNEVTSWSDSQGGGEIAATEGGSFPDNDYGLAMYTADTDAPSEVNLYDGSTQAISGAGEATVGQTVTRSGSTTQVHDGEVLAVDASVSYPQGTVNGLIHTNVCAEPGDSGGALFAGDKALGMTSGGSGDCSAGGETYFQPVGEALDAYGAQIG